MNRYSNPKLKECAQRLRREMTREERHLWYDFLKQLPVTCNRQKVIGPYIADFYCAAAGLIIELDGSQHYETQAAERDRARTAYFHSLGLTVVRYSNSDVNHHFQAVCADILKRLPLEGKLSPQVTDEV
ncbi:MAG: endonuclease domain-containing protein [Clostridia bacterium]|nr:endonuclease domain-containing protein [Clostridia bacterium]